MSKTKAIIWTVVVCGFYVFVEVGCEFIFFPEPLDWRRLAIQEAALLLAVGVILVVWNRRQPTRSDEASKRRGQMVKTKAIIWTVVTWGFVVFTGNVLGFIFSASDWRRVAILTVVALLAVGVTLAVWRKHWEEVGASSASSSAAVD